MSDILLRGWVRAQSALYDVRDREEGQTMTEYAIIIAAVAVLLIVALLFLSGRIGSLFSKTGSSISNYWSDAEGVDLPVRRPGTPSFGPAYVWSRNLHPKVWSEPTHRPVAEIDVRPDCESAR
jgi:Flp pilus assembly pilin Flp